MKDAAQEQINHLKRAAELQNDIAGGHFWGTIEITIRAGKLVMKRIIQTEEIK